LRSLTEIELCRYFCYRRAWVNRSQGYANEEQDKCVFFFVKNSGILAEGVRILCNVLRSSLLFDIELAFAYFIMLFFFCSKILYRLLQSWVRSNIAEEMYFSLLKCRLISFVFHLYWIFNYERVALQAERPLSAVTQHCQFIPLFGMSFIHKMGLPLPSSLTLPREMANPECSVPSLCRTEQFPGDNNIFTPYTTLFPHY
jgi:hypothetical protein